MAFTLRQITLQKLVYLFTEKIYFYDSNGQVYGVCVKAPLGIAEFFNFVRIVWMVAGNYSLGAQLPSNITRPWAVVVVMWSASSPSSPTIRVRILLKPKFFSMILCLKRTKINKKEAGVGPIKKTFLGRNSAIKRFILGRFRHQRIYFSNF